MENVFAFVLLFGGVGLVSGVALGAWLHRFKVVVGLVALGIGAAIVLMRSFHDPECVDDCPEALGVLVVLANLAGWAFGLTTGTGIAKLVGHRR